MTRRLAFVLSLLISAAGLVIPATGATAGAASHVKSYPLDHARTCRAGFVKRTERHGKHGRRYVACVEIPKAPAAVPVPVRAAIDPSFTQSSSDPLSVTFSYSASDVGATSLPDGVLTLTIQQTGAAGATSTCTANVGGSVTGGSCTVELPSYGDWDLVVTYSGGSDVSATSATETVDVENPNPPAAPAPPPATEPTGTTGATSTTSTTTTSTTVPTPLATTTVLSMGATQPDGQYPFTATVTDANGPVTSGTVTYTFLVAWDGGVRPNGEVTAAVGQTCDIGIAGGHIGGQVESDDCTVSESGTGGLLIDASYSGSSTDASSYSNELSYP